jgi:hypothetical protein
VPLFRESAGTQPAGARGRALEPRAPSAPGLGLLENSPRHITVRNLAAPAAERGDHEEARRLCEAVLAACPGDSQAMVKRGPAPYRMANRPDVQHEG